MDGEHQQAGRYFAREEPPAGHVPAAGSWHELAAIEPVEFVPGLTFRPVVGERMLLNVASYEPHTVVPEHSHAEEQLTFVLEGEFEFEIAGETRLLRPGTVAHIPPHVPHAARTHDVGCVQVDVFSPPRRVLLDLLGRGTGADGG